MTPHNPLDEFFADLDALAGDGPFVPPPPDEYELVVTSYGIKLTKSNTHMAHLRFDIAPDEPHGHKGVVWENAILEGVDKNGRSASFTVARLVKALIHYDPQCAQELVPLPGWDREAKMCMIPVYENGKPDLSDWKAWLDGIIGKHFYAKTKNEPRKRRDSSGKLNETGEFDTAIDRYITD
jgi:hypothetical protein